MPKRKSSRSKPKKVVEPQPPLPLLPDRFYRQYEVIANRYLGYAGTRLLEKIRAGEIEAPIVLSARCCGWFGRDLLRMQAAMRNAEAA
jgi:hypothetical protein